ncbi:MAG: hypothetical protein GY755_00275 [Chloroflexi bacterium]|nr:hypothetical protein [Chloroflexota bacterium]
MFYIQGSIPTNCHCEAQGFLGEAISLSAWEIATLHTHYAVSAGKHAPRNDINLSFI